MRRALVTVTTLLVLLSCRDEQAGPRPRAPALPPPQQARLLDTAPADLTFTSNGTWAGGAVRYLGSRVRSNGPNQPFTVAHYFRAERQPPAGFQFFVHLVDPDSGGMVANLDHPIHAGAIDRWPVGKVVEDVHSVPLPPGLASGEIRMGFWAGDQRLPVDLPEAHDGTHRMIGPRLGSAPQLPEYRIRRTTTAPKLDGVVDDAAWKDATPAVLVGSFDGRPASLRTVARLTYDDRHLYVAFEAEDPDAWGSLFQRDEPIYTQEVVEVFLDANADGRTYNELQVSPNNVLFDAYFPARRQGMDLAWDSKMKTAVRVDGKVNDDGDRDRGWSAEMQIPFATLAQVPNTPPKRGDRWRFNLYRLEMHDRKNVEGMAFSPLFVGDFHALPRFGWLVFE